MDRLTLRIFLAAPYLGHTVAPHHRSGIRCGSVYRFSCPGICEETSETLAAISALQYPCVPVTGVLSSTRRCETQPMATQTRFRGPAAPGQAISLDRAPDEATRAAEAWVPPSWDQVVREHADRVYRLAYRLSGNPHDAEDLTQETFIRVFRSLGSYKPGTFEGWLHRITTNLFLDMVRRRARLRMEGLPEDTDRLVGGGPSPEQVYVATHLDPDLQQALDDLAPEFRAAVVLCDVEGLSYEEIGATLGVKLGTVRSRIHRGRQALKAALEKRRADAE